SHGPDLIVTDLFEIGNFASSGSLESFVFGAIACNLGDQEASWDQCPANTHPVFGGNLYKWYSSGGATRFEQIGQSWLKNGFGADRAHNCCANCAPSGTETRLGLGCSDTYTASEFTASAVGPKYLVNAHTGSYPVSFCSTHPSGDNGSLDVAIS